MKRKYNHIFFDLDNTLWDFKKNSENAMKVTYEHFLNKNNVSFKTFFEVYTINNKLLWEEYRNKNIGKKELIHKRFQLTFDKLGISSVIPEEMNLFYLEAMAMQKQLKRGVPEILEYLSSGNYHLYIITNGFKDVQCKKLEISGLKTYFKNVYVSENIGNPKPGHEFYEYAIKSSNAKKIDSLVVGDDWEADIIGANKFGLDAVFIPCEKNNEINDRLKDVNRKNSIYFLNEIIDLKKIV